MLDKIKGAILGHAVGDALGVPVEFCTRSELEIKPVSDMEGHGTHDKDAGVWSDDTSMTIASFDSLIHRLDYNSVMDNFAAWLGDAKYTADGDVFDVGNSCRKSILLYVAENLPAVECGQSSEWDNGNGSLMRILPFSLYTYYQRFANPLDVIHNASRLTHAHERSAVGCGIYSFIVWELLEFPSKESVYRGLMKAAAFYGDSDELEHYARLLEMDFASLDASEINSSGYIVDTLEAAVWCLLNSECYSECVLRAVNLGEDTDTVAAVAGGMAGILWGFKEIPEKWLLKLARRDYIEDMCIRACSAWCL